MLKPVLALIAAAALPAAATSQTSGEAHLWHIASEGSACMVTTDTDDATVLSILAAPTDGAFIFLVQNPAWQSLRDGTTYPVAIEFDDMGPWQIQASARETIDADGPGLAFHVAPGRADGNGFIQEMIAAESMKIVAGGNHMGSLDVSGSEGAMQELAGCMAASWAGITGDDRVTIPASSDNPARPL